MMRVPRKLLTGGAALVLCLQASAAFGAPASDTVEKFRRQYGSTPSSGWTPALNIVIGSVEAVKKGARPWRMNVLSNKGFEYNMIVGRGSVILVDKKKTSEPEFIRRIQLGDRVLVHFTNNKDGDLITRFIEILPAKGDDTLLEPRTVEGSMKAYMLGRSPKMQVATLDGKNPIVLFENLTVVRKGEQRISLNEFYKNIAATRYVRIEYVARGDENVARTVELLDAPPTSAAPSPQAPGTAPAAVAEETRSLEGFLKAFQPATRPNLLLQEKDGSETIFSIGPEAKFSAEAGEREFEEFFQRMKERRIRNLGAELTGRPGAWRAVSVRILPGPNEPVAKNQEDQKARSAPRPADDKLSKVSGHVKAFMGGPAPRLLIVDAQNGEHNVVLAESVKIAWRGRKIGVEELFVKIRSHRVLAEVGDQGKEKVAYSVEVI